ncbi:hypothetical protein [Deinococcus roseus]|uniref:Uncharacterized protein n=1 Tax=Deinococcus roseus TaxID=392414 RepID=A0ABQ2DEV6_9DEIO|nr:hypothetical protein [Deinococcus roseus]GGJ55532.1 hypothetical protein GCM10008938_47130 [Deinococcus roseus]
MPSIQVKDGHLSVYQVLTELGFLQPGKVWKQLLDRKGKDFMVHTRLQFEMADGRKSRLVPAIREDDLGELLDGVRQMSGQGQTGWFYLPVERQVLDTLTAAFQDLQPKNPCELDGVRVDVFFQACKVAVVFFSSTTLDAVRIVQMNAGGMREVQVNVYHTKFRLGHLVC